MTRFAQVGTKHGHAAGKLKALLDHPGVEVAGVFEPDAARRAEVAGSAPYRGLRWFGSLGEILDDPAITAVASEGHNAESLDQTEALVHARKHVWYDKPAGTDYERWRRVVDTARRNGTHLQMGYMLRYHDGFRRVADWARAGFLGDITSIRGHMSTWLPVERREDMARFRGGIFFDLGAHMLDQVVWILGRPETVTPFLRNDSDARACVDNSLCVFEYGRAIAFLDISSFEVRPMARRFEVYGTRGSAIILEPFEPGHAIRLALDAAREGFSAGEQTVPFGGVSRQALYDRELVAFLSVIADGRSPDRQPDHELLVQETLLRAAGYLP
jgi:predicted dehydrogenase